MVYFFSIYLERHLYHILNFHVNEGVGKAVSEISSVKFIGLPVFVLIVLREFSKGSAYKVNMHN